MTVERIFMQRTIVKSVWVLSIQIIMSLPIQARMAFHQSVPLNPDSVIFQKWIYSHEEDSTDTIIYKSFNIDYPLSWGRPGMKYQKNGSFVLYELGPNDQLIQLHGVWKPLSKSVLEITFPNGERENFQIEIKVLTPHILKIIKL